MGMVAYFKIYSDTEPDMPSSDGAVQERLISPRFVPVSALRSEIVVGGMVSAVSDTSKAFSTTYGLPIGPEQLPEQFL